MAATRLTTLTLFLAACGGSTPPSPPPPPPPPPGPATVTIEAGGQQTAGSREPVPVAPTVVVRDAQGRPLSGVSVQFAVTAGGGTVEGGSPTTDAAGIAKVTTWRLGATGEQTLSAQVGSLTPAVFRATILPGSETIDVGIGTGGGSFEITTPNHPYRGLKLTVPAGTFTAPGNWQFRVPANPVLPVLPAGYQVAGPVLEVATEQPRGEHLMTLDIPIPRTAGRATVIALYDPARRTMEVMPTVARTATTIRVATAHFRADLLLGPAAVAPAGVAFGASRGITIGSLIPLDFLLPAPPVPLLIDPATDRWPVLEHGSAQAPNGHGAAIAGFEALNLALRGPAMSSLVKGLAEPGFYAESAPLGTLVQGFRRLLRSLDPVLQELNEQLRPLPKPERDELVSQTMSANLALRGVTPAVFITSTGISDVFANAIGSSDGNLTLIRGAIKAVLQLGRTPATGFGTTEVEATVGGPSQSASGLLPLPSMVLPFETLRDLHGELQQIAALAGKARAVLNKAIADKAGLPEVTMEQEVVAGGGWEPIVDDKLTLRSSKATIRIPSLGGGFVISFPTSGAEAGRSDSRSLLIGAGAVLAGLSSEPTPIVVSPFIRISGLVKQMTARVLEAVKAPYQVTPDNFKLTGDLREVVFDAAVPSPPVGGFRIKWDWGDGKTSENLSLTNATHTYDKQGDYQVISTLLAAESRAVLSADTVMVDFDPAPFWQITSLVDEDELLDTSEPDGSDPFWALARRVLAVPQSGLIAIEEEPGGQTVLRLRVLPTTTWSLSNCCPTSLAPLPGEQQLSLGVSPSVSYSVGPFFAGYNVSRLAQSTTDLETGTVTGQFVHGGLISRAIEDGGTQAGPRDLTRFSATRSGRTMTGTIEVYGWGIDLETGEVTKDGNPSASRLTFTAVRLR